MKPSAHSDSQSESDPLTPEQEAAAKAAAVWVHHFARTLKTCRLYDASNPTVVRFRQEIATALNQLLGEHGAIDLTFTAEDVLCEGVSLYPAKSRDDNIAFPFFRDGIRRITFSPGIETRELESVIDGVLLVTGQNLEHNDLVTLLWEAHLPHIEIDYIPAEPDIGTATDGEEGVPWPTAAALDEAEEAARTAEAPQVDVSPETTAYLPRSDDWTVGELTAEIEAAFEELQSLAPGEVHRFQQEYLHERQASIVATSTEVVRAYLSSEGGTQDCAEILRFLPRVLRQAFVQGSWREAAEVVALLEWGQSPDWTKQTFAQELLQPISVSSVRERLEQQEPEMVADFIMFVRLLGEPAVDLLNLVLAETQNPRHQKLLTDAIVELCHDNPERLAPWLSDPRWFVVRNIVQILGSIGGDSIVGLLRPLTEHPETRIRLEVVAALRNAKGGQARRLLIGMIDDADTRMFCSVLHLLSQERDPEIAQHLFTMMLDPEFEKRPPEEKRAIYSAVGGTGGDEVVPELEAELNKGNWFSRTQEAHRQAVARCLARIGTPLALQALHQGAASRRAPVRKACEDALVQARAA
jgi:hypothetical protein